VSWPGDPLRRVLAAVDGSSTSVKAAEAAIALAAAAGADVVLLHVLDETLLRDLAALGGDRPEAVRQRLESRGDEMLRDLCASAAGRQVSCSRRIEPGDPPHVIDEVAREIGADVVFVGKVGRRGVRRWMIGSVTRRLIEVTHVPVVVIAVPPDEASG
jgi:nucleotide-binding universal stress UspA family protein